MLRAFEQQELKQRNRESCAKQTKELKALLEQGRGAAGLPCLRTGGWSK